MYKHKLKEKFYGYHETRAENSRLLQLSIYFQIMYCKHDTETTFILSITVLKVYPCI